MSCAQFWSRFCICFLFNNAKSLCCAVLLRAGSGCSHLGTAHTQRCHGPCHEIPPGPPGQGSAAGRSSPRQQCPPSELFVRKKGGVGVEENANQMISSVLELDKD